MIKKLFRSALKTLPHRLRYEVFYQSARSLGVSGYLAEGTAGSFLGSIEDQSVIRPYLRQGLWSENIVGLFSDYFRLQHGGTFIDVGANIGLVTAPISRIPDVQCIAIEPDLWNYGMLQANVIRNAGERRVQTINAAVADQIGRMNFTRSAYNSGDHRLSLSGETSVPVITLDNLELPAGPVGIKMDTQGAEPLIFAGGETALRRAGLVVCEFWPWGMARMGLSPDAVIGFVRESGRSGHLLRHDAAPGALLSSDALLAALQQVIDDGSEWAQADLVLVS